MIHHMRLDSQPFAAIVCGQKTIELRLNDEKRQTIKAGDRIVFANTDDPSLTVTVEVIALHRFATFTDLYKALPLEKCGYAHEAAASATPADMERYYSLDRQRKYGVLGIEIKAVEN